MQRAPEWLTDYEAATRARMALKTFQAKVRAGYGPEPSGGTGGRRLWRVESIDRWIESNANESRD